MTKNASQSSNPQTHRLTLVDRNGHLISPPQGEDETSAEYQAPDGIHSASDRPADAGKTKLWDQRGQLIAFTAVSVGCAMGALAAGSYAVWLSRYKAAGETLDSVHDLLETCRDRVTRMEEELAGLPSRS